MPVSSSISSNDGGERNVVDPGKLSNWMQDVANISTDLERVEDSVDQLKKLRKDIIQALHEHTAKATNSRITWMTPQVKETQKMVDRQCVKVTRRDIDKAIDKTGAKFRILLAVDRTYYAIPMDIWKRIINETKVEDHRYRAEKRDCDDFAKFFSGLVSIRYGTNGAGQVLDMEGKHAYNILLVVDDRGSLSVVYLEPQNDKIVSMKKGTPYTGGNGYVLF